MQKSNYACNTLAFKSAWILCEGQVNGLHTDQCEAVLRNLKLATTYIQVEDISVRITHVEGAMPPGLGRQLLDPLDMEAFEPRVLTPDIRDFQLRSIYSSL
jgi:hypothetical protein